MGLLIFIVKKYILLFILKTLAFGLLLMLNDVVYVMPRLCVYFDPNFTL
jgi:hypothetical protein